jgi:hypothetical protein
MGSKQTQTRQLQKERYEELLAKRKVLLAEQNIPLPKQAKDKGVKRLQAKINQITRAIASIQKMQAVLEKATIAKQKNVEQKKADKSKSKKQKAEPAPEKEANKEKEKKKKKKTEKK